MRSIPYLIVSTLFFALSFPSLIAANKEVPVEVNKAIKQFTGDDTALIEPSAVEGFYAVRTGGGIVFYVSADGRHIFYGELMDVREKINYTKRMEREFALELLGELGEDRIISYIPAKEKYRAVVFTDPNCGFCRKFHAQMPRLLSQGVRIDYVMIALQGGDSGFDRTVSIWCAPDRNRAMDVAKAGGAVKPAKCDHPLKENQILSAKLNVRGTPSIFLPNGVKIGGYLPPDRLVEALQEVAQRG